MKNYNIYTPKNYKIYAPINMNECRFDNSEGEFMLREGVITNFIKGIIVDRYDFEKICEFVHNWMAFIHIWPEFGKDTPIIILDHITDEEVGRIHYEEGEAPIDYISEIMRFIDDNAEYIIDYKETEYDYNGENPKTIITQLKRHEEATAMNDYQGLYQGLLTQAEIYSESFEVDFGEYEDDYGCRHIRMSLSRGLDLKKKKIMARNIEINYYKK